MPNTSLPCPLAPALAERIRSARTPLTLAWLDRISARVALDSRRVFPTDDLVDHVPILLDGIAAYLEDPSQEVSADTPVVAEAMELGALRHEQGFDEYEILKEFELLRRHPSRIWRARCARSSRRLGRRSFSSADTVSSAPSR